MAVIVLDCRFVGGEEKAFHELGDEGGFADAATTHDDDSVGLADLHAGSRVSGWVRGRNETDAVTSWSRKMLSQDRFRFGGESITART